MEVVGNIPALLCPGWLVVNAVAGKVQKLLEGVGPLYIIPPIPPIPPMPPIPAEFKVNVVQ